VKQALEDVKTMMEKEDDEEILELSESSLVNVAEENRVPEIIQQTNPNSTDSNYVGVDDIIKQADQAANSLNSTNNSHSVKDRQENLENAHIENSLSSTISVKAAMETTASLKSLIKTVERKNQDGLSFRNGLLVEDLIKELIKPQISSWLDSNLPGIVKSVVEKEVRKLIPKED
jgi:cell pole-organizing protein PopZ